MDSDKKDLRISRSGSIIVILLFLCLLMLIAVARWSWLLLDEQIELRRDFQDLQARQEQVEIQYEFWLDQVEKKLP